MLPFLATFSMNAALLMVRSLLSLPDRLDLHVTATYSGHRSRAHQKWRTVRALGRPYVVRVRFNRLGPVLDEVRAVNGGEAPANGEEYGSKGSGPSAPGAGPARTGRPPPRTAEAVSISPSVSPSSWGRKGSQGCDERGLDVEAVGWPLIPTWERHGYSLYGNQPITIR